MADVKRELEQVATRILRQHGYTAGGRPRGAVPREQHLFERRMIGVPMGGKPKGSRAANRSQTTSTARDGSLFFLF